MRLCDNTGLKCLNRDMVLHTGGTLTPTCYQPQCVHIGVPAPEKQRTGKEILVEFVWSLSTGDRIALQDYLTCKFGKSRL